MPTKGGVLFRQWEVGAFIGGVREDGSSRSLGREMTLFPEDDSQGRIPFRVDGRTLIERAAIADSFEEGSVARISREDSQQIDLRIRLDEGDFSVETDDFEAFSSLERYLQLHSRR